MPLHEEDRFYLEHKYPDPDFPPETGLEQDALREKINESFRENRSMDIIDWKAQAVEYILDNVRIDVSAHDWFVGLNSWLRKDTERVSMWTLFDEILHKYMTKEQRAFRNGAMNAYLAEMRYDFAHSVPEWEAVLRLGFPGLRNRAKEYDKMFTETDRHTDETRRRFQGIERVFAATDRLLGRLIERAKLNVPQGGRRSELTLKCLEHLREGQPTNTYEALQLIWLYHQLSEYVDCIQTRSLGNLDRLLYPFYKRDIETGTLTQDEIREIFAYFLYQQSIIKYEWGHPFYLGGTDEQGHTNINELSYLIVDEYDKLNIYDPKIHIKVALNTPPPFIRKILDMVRYGHSSFVFVGEPCIERTLLRLGCTLQEARSAVIKGCYEYSPNGNSVETATVKLNCATIVSLALGNGVDIYSGFDTGCRTGELQELDSFEKFLTACETQMAALAERCCQINDLFEAHTYEINPCFYMSASSVTALEKGKDGYADGEKYNLTNIWLQFPASGADAMVSVKHAVYDQKFMTLEQMKDALQKDWVGYEHQRATIQSDKTRFGNNIPEVDDIAKRYLENFARKFHGRPNARGGFYTVALHSANDFTRYREWVGATADGRKRGDELSKNITPESGCSHAGVTAAMESVFKIDSSLFPADAALDIMLHPTAVQGEDGLEVFRSLVMTFIAHYGHAIHFNVFDVNTLRDAQKHPENYADLQVRICGWNVLWNNLTRNEQDNYILQASQLQA